MREDLKPAAALFAKACRASRLHIALAGRAGDRYGWHGSLVSGVMRSHFPETVKIRLRKLARAAGDYSDAARQAAPPRVRLSTMNRLAEYIAARDGSGRYGPTCGCRVSIMADRGRFAVLGVK